MPRTIRRPVVPFSSLMTTWAMAPPKLSPASREVRDVERVTRVPV